MGPSMSDTVGQWAAQLRSGLHQHANGLANQDRAGPVPVPQIMQPRPASGVMTRT